MHSSKSLQLLFLLSSILPVACTTTGTGTGYSLNSDVRASFAWQSSGTGTGKLTATLSSGDIYQGSYFQVTRASSVQYLAPLWRGWHRTWRGWRYWDNQPSVAFVTHSTGRVVALLDGPNDNHMRCVFRLRQPARGMAGGGQGKCQLPSGKNIAAKLDAAQ